MLSMRVTEGSLPDCRTPTGVPDRVPARHAGRPRPDLPAVTEAEG